MNEDHCTPKEEKQERLSRHKETMQRSQAEEEAHLLAQQRLVYDRSCRALKRRSLVRKHEFEQDQLREVGLGSRRRSRSKVRRQTAVYVNENIKLFSSTLVSTLLQTLTLFSLFLFKDKSSFLFFLFKHYFTFTGRWR